VFKRIALLSAVLCLLHVEMIAAPRQAALSVSKQPVIIILKQPVIIILHGSNGSGQ
jgi:hypothetical protein